MLKYYVNPVMQNAEKWLNIILKSCGVHTARFLKYAWPFLNIKKQCQSSFLVDWKVDEGLKIYDFYGRSVDTIMYTEFV